MPVSSVTEHWIKPDAVTINLNHFGDPDYLQVSVLAGAVVMAFKQGVIAYNAAHNYRTWPLQAANTYLETTSAYNVYARLTRSEVNASALIVYDPILRNIEGRPISHSEKGDEVLGDADSTYYYVFLGQISSSVGSSGQSTSREWIVDFRFGNLDTSQYRNEEAGGEWQKMFRLNEVTDMIDVLKTFSLAVFKKLFIGEKEIIDVKRSVDSDEAVPVSDSTIPTTKYVREANDDRYLRKDQDDKTPFNLGVGKSLSVGEDLEVKGSASIGGEMKSDDFVAGDLMGSGWAIYRDSNGNTVVETDRIVARKSLEATELVVNQETFEKGSNIFVKGGCTITKVEIVNGRYRCYYNNEEGRRFSGFKVGDQARCQRYNASYGGIIKYYWRLVTGVEEDYVELSMTDCDGTGIPEEGDDIAQLGSRYDKTRQSAIVISPDNGGSVIIWAGIDSYDLSEKNMVGMGVNPNTGRAYLYGYGDMFFGDRSLEKNYITYQTREGDTEPTLNINADIHFGKGSDGLSNLSEFKDIQDEVDNLFGQIEREFTIWYYDYEPTLDNEPAVNWVTDADKALHDQDIFFSDKLARAWRFVNGTWIEITDERTLSALKLAEEAEKNAREAKEYIDNILPSKLEELQNQIDGAIESFFYKYDPTTSNEPASLWTTEEQKAMHLNDTFTNLESGYSWRWTVNEGIYGWTEISDTATVKALVAAGQAQDTADQKRRVFVVTPYTPYDEGDLWVQGETGDILRCSNSRTSGNFDSSDWVKASKYTDDSALETFLNGAYKEQLEAIQSQIDSRAETWYQSTDPSLQWTTDALKQQHVGDLWYDINKAQSFMWNGSEWVVQGVPDEVYDKIDGKSSIYTSQPSTYKKNDLWILASDTTLDKAYKSGTIVVAKQDSDVFVKEHWTKKDYYTDDSRADEAYEKAEEAYRKAESFSEDLTGVLADMEIVMNQVDREFTIWYYNHVPTLDNAPAVDWDTDEEKQRHDQDICFSDELARAWRFVDGQWVEITDERTLAVLKQVEDLEYLKNAFGSDERVMEGGIIVSTLVSVRNKEGNLEAFINGSEFANDAEHGKLILAGGIPDKTSDGLDDLQARSKEATTRVYEDGSAFFGNANISGSFNSGDGKTSFNKDGSGQLANGNIKWDSDGTMWKKSPEYIVWRRIEEEYEDGDTIDLQGGSYLDITVGIDFPEYALPSPETDKTVAVKYIGVTRRDGPAILVGNFNINGAETTRITIAGSGRSFELEYKTTTGKWHYYGYSGVGYFEKYGDVVVLLDKEEESTTPSINGLTKTIKIYGVYGDYELTFESGILTGYVFNPTEGGN